MVASREVGDTKPGVAFSKAAVTYSIRDGTICMCFGVRRDTPAYMSEEIGTSSYSRTNTSLLRHLIGIYLYNRDIMNIHSRQAVKIVTGACKLM
jgi:hypothetical protein